MACSSEVCRKSWILTKNSELVKKFLTQGAPSEIVVELQRAPETKSGYRWSSTKGSEVEVYSGTLCTTEIVIREQKPITLVLTWFKEIF